MKLEGHLCDVDSWLNLTLLSPNHPVLLILRVSIQASKTELSKEDSFHSAPVPGEGSVLPYLDNPNPGSLLVGSLAPTHRRSIFLNHFNPRPPLG